MNTQAPKKALIEIEKAEYVVNAIETHRSGVSVELTTVYSTLPQPGEGEDTTRSDWNVVQQENADLVKDAVRGVLEASQSYHVAKVTVADTTKERDDAASSLASYHRSIRNSTRGTYDPSALALVGLDTPPVRPLVGMREQCRDMVQRMRHPELRSRLGDPLAGQDAINFNKIANVMQSQLQRYETAIAGVNRARKRRDETYVEREEAIRRLRNTTVNIARVQEGYYRLVDLDELADRLRLTIPQPRKTEPGSTDQEPPPPPSA